MQLMFVFVSFPEKDTEKTPSSWKDRERTRKFAEEEVTKLIECDDEFAVRSAKWLWTVTDPIAGNDGMGLNRFDEMRFGHLFRSLVNGEGADLRCIRKVLRKYKKQITSRVNRPWRRYYSGGSRR